MNITRPMYEKGRSFVMAAGLVKAYEGHNFVYLHLLCQGFENIGKALLLRFNYDKYGPLLKSVYGHNLTLLLDELLVHYGNSFLSAEAAAEVAVLTSFYNKHQLRYGDKFDFLVDHSTLTAAKLHGELVFMFANYNKIFTIES